MVKTNRFDGSSIRVLALLPAVSILSACALIPTFVEAPDVQIEKLSTPTVRVISASLWRYRSQLSLRGEVVARSTGKSPLRGHLDISISRPNREDASCLTTRQGLGARRVRKSYYVELDAMPPPGSLIQVWHHPTSRHESCDVPLLMSMMRRPWPMRQSEWPWEPPVRMSRSKRRMLPK